MINPGTRPLTNAGEEVAAGNLAAFLAEVSAYAAELDKVALRHRVSGISGEPVRAPEADRDGRFAWDVPLSDGTRVPVLMPGVPLAQVREDLSTAAPCLYLGAVPAWWSGAVSSLAGEGLRLR